MEIGTIRKAIDIGYLGKNTYIWSACVDCGKERWVKLLRNNPQNLRCKGCAGKGKLHYGWKGGRIIDKDGYVRIWLHPSDFFYPMANNQGYALEQRLVIAKKLGRCLQAWELIHHKDGIRSRNTDDNLEMTTKGNHIREHSKGYRDGYQKGLVDGRTKQVEELKDEIKEQTKLIRLLQWQLRESTKQEVK